MFLCCYPDRISAHFKISTILNADISTSAEVASFNRVPIGPRFAANRGALPTRLNDIMPNDFCRGAYSIAFFEACGMVHDAEVDSRGRRISLESPCHVDGEPTEGQFAR